MYALCNLCSYAADHADGAIPHARHHLRGHARRRLSQSLSMCFQLLRDRRSRLTCHADAARLPRPLRFPRS